MNIIEKIIGICCIVNIALIIALVYFLILIYKESINDNINFIGKELKSLIDFADDND